MEELEQFPKLDCMTYFTPQEAKMWAKIMNEIYDKLRELDRRVVMLEIEAAKNAKVS